MRKSVMQCSQCKVRASQWRRSWSPLVDQDSYYVVENQEHASRCPALTQIVKPLRIFRLLPLAFIGILQPFPGFHPFLRCFRFVLSISVLLWQRLSEGFALFRYCNLSKLYTSPTVSSVPLYNVLLSLYYLSANFRVIVYGYTFGRKQGALRFSRMEGVFKQKLPSIKTVKGDPVSSTDVKYLDELLGRFEFVEYVDFHKDALETASLICETLTSEESDVPKKFLDGVHAMSKPPLLSDETLQRVRNVRLMGRISLPGMPHEKIVYPDELSMGSLYDGVLQAVSSILQMMTASTRYKLVTRKIMSQLHRVAEKEKLRSHAEQKMRAKKAEKLSREASDRLQAEEGLQRTRRRTQLRAAQLFLETSSNDQQTATPMPTPDSVTLNAQEKLEIENFLNNAKESFKYLLPDYCLMRFGLRNPSQGEVICCIELKGPQKDITGRGHEAAWGCTMASETELQENLIDIPSEVARDSSPLLAARLNWVMSEQYEGQSHGTSRRSARRAISQALAYALETSSGMCYLWNWGDGVVLRVVPKEEERGKATVYVAIVNETLRNQLGHLGSIVHFCTVAAKEANAKDVGEALDQLRNDIANDISRNGREGLEDSRAGESGSAASGEVSSVMSGENAGDSDSQAAQHTSLPDTISLMRPIPFKSQKMDPSFPVNSDDRTPSPNTFDYHSNKRKLNIPSAGAVEVNRAAKMICKKVTSLLQSDCDERKSEFDRHNSLLAGDLTEDEVVVLLSTAHLRKIGTGMSGVVFEGRLRGCAVAVKLWNKACLLGLSSLKREIDCYEWLQKFYPATLGCAVPRVIMYWNFGELSSCPETVGLVMDLVGRSIQYKGNGVFAVVGGGRTMDVKGLEIRPLCDAALKSLSKLHESGLLHGDVELQNLRVECYDLSDARGTTYPGCSFRWRAWWIDLGNAEAVTQRTSKMKNIEMEDCRAMLMCSRVSSPS